MNISILQKITAILTTAAILLPLTGGGAASVAFAEKAKLSTGYSYYSKVVAPILKPVCLLQLPYWIIIYLDGKSPPSQRMERSLFCKKTINWPRWMLPQAKNCGNSEALWLLFSLTVTVMCMG
jgi:hypothetical protein